MLIKYKCRCMLNHVEISVPDRRPKADILEWMEMLQRCVTVDHRALNPICTATRIDEMMIPHDEHQQEIGVPIKKQ